MIPVFVTKYLAGKDFPKLNNLIDNPKQYLLRM